MRKEKFAAIAAEREGKAPGAPRFTVTDKQRKVARNVIRKGMTYKAAMIDAGYSPKQAAKGLSEITKRKSLRQAWQDEMKKAENVGEMIPSPAALENLIMARLTDNIVKGKDHAVISCKLAGSHKKLNLWETDYQQGIIILNAPPMETGEMPFGMPEVPKNDE